MRLRPANATGTGLGNYTISYVNGGLTVTPASLTITANNQTQVYGNATPTLTYTIGGLVNGDTLSGSLATTASSTSNVGSYAITQGSLAASTNYAITYTGANDVVGTRAITVAANAQSQVYGNATPTLTYTVGGLGLVNGDTLSGGLATSASSTANVGSYGITQGTLAASANYAVSFTGANLTLSPASITVSALGGTSVAGTSPINPGFTADGLKNGENVGVLTGLSNSFGITAATSSSGSPYTLTVIGLLTDANYVISARNTAIWSVTPASGSTTASSDIIGDTSAPIRARTTAAIDGLSGSVQSPTSTIQTATTALPNDTSTIQTGTTLAGDAKAGTAPDGQPGEQSQQSTAVKAATCHIDRVTSIVVCD